MPKLFMLLIGCKPQGRHVEQHDVFFAIADSVRDTIAQVKAFWPEGKSSLHYDAWREVTKVDGYRVDVITSPGSKSSIQFSGIGGTLQSPGPRSSIQLFFINL